MTSIKKTMTVEAPIETAFRVFTEMKRWWPLDSHKLGKAKAVDAIVEPRVGGRWYEKGEDGSECDWGRVLHWEPPKKLVLTWDIDADFKSDPNLHTEVELNFIAETPLSNNAFPKPSPPMYQYKAS